MKITYSIRIFISLTTYIFHWDTIIKRIKMESKCKLVVAAIFDRSWFNLVYFRLRRESDIAAFRRAIWPGETCMAIIGMSWWRSGVRLEKRFRADTSWSRRSSRTHEIGPSTAGLYGTKTSSLRPTSQII